MKHRKPRDAIRGMQQRPRQPEQIQHLLPLPERIDLGCEVGNCALAPISLQFRDNLPHMVPRTKKHRDPPRLNPVRRKRSCKPFDGDLPYLPSVPSESACVVRSPCHPPKR